MGEDPNQDGKRFDPLDAWRGVRDIYMDAWSKNMVEMVNTEAYAQATGAMLDTYLTASTPFREALEKAMVKTLEQLAMPTRADVVSIAERMTNIEMRLDDLDAKLDTIQRLITQAGAGPQPQPRKAPQPAKKTVAAKKTTKRGRK
jgi:polyhydroxyalkanoic acid synthase PhaR subunit